MKSPVSLSLTVLASAALVILAAAPASAHTSLIDVQPGEGDTVREGAIVSLTFSDALLDIGTEISVTDSSGDSVALDVQRPVPESVAATLPALAPGPVTVSWRVVAKDGHPIEGTLTYVSEGSGPSASDLASPTASVSAVPSPAPVTATPSPSPSPQPDSGNDSSNSGINWGVWIAISVAIFAATGAGVATKKRR